MTKPKERLKNLINSEACTAENLENYRNELLLLAKKANVNQSRKQSKLFKALSDEKRLMILKLLLVKEMCVCELVIALDTTQPNLSHHLKILENQNFVKRRKEGKWAYYSLMNKENIKKMIDLLIEIGN
jgi:ArsR family transcriptional regulator